MPKTKQSMSFFKEGTESIMHPVRTYEEMKNIYSEAKKNNPPRARYLRNLMVSSIGLYSLGMFAVVELNKRVVNYIYASKPIEIIQKDINNDGILDQIHVMKDGRRIEFLGKKTDNGIEYVKK